MSRLKFCVCVFSIANFLFRMKYIMATKTTKLKFSMAQRTEKKQCLKVNVKAISKAYKPVINFSPIILLNLYRKPNCNFIC